MAYIKTDKKKITAKLYGLTVIFLNIVFPLDGGDGEDRARYLLNEVIAERTCEDEEALYNTFGLAKGTSVLFCSQ